jgi:hypothetical protein
VTDRNKGGSRRSALALRYYASASFALSGLSAALAADGDLQRALLEAGCVDPRIETLLQQRELVVYRARCLGSPRKTIVVTCSNGRCSAERQVGEGDR